jgi:hypothetical protein
MSEERIIDERRFRREDSLNIVDYIVLGEDGEHEDRGMGLTLNVGECGILLETHVPLDEKQILLIHIGFEDTTIDLKGKVTYTATTEDKKHRAGVEFMEIDKKDRDLLRGYLKALVYKVNKPEEEKDTVAIPVTESTSETENGQKTKKAQEPEIISEIIINPDIKKDLKAKKDSNTKEDSDTKEDLNTKKDPDTKEDPDIKKDSLKEKVEPKKKKRTLFRKK